MRAEEGLVDAWLLGHDPDAVGSIDTDMIRPEQVRVPRDIDALAAGVPPVEIARLDVIPVREDDPPARQLVG